MSEHSFLKICFPFHINDHIERSIKESTTLRVTEGDFIETLCPACLITDKLSNPAVLEPATTFPSIISADRTCY